MVDRVKRIASEPKPVGVREFRSNFSGFMRQVRQGSSFAVTSRDAVVAIIAPPPAREARRRPGTLRGQIRLAPDFDVTSPDLLAALEGAHD